LENTSHQDPTGAARHREPSLMAVAIVYVVLFLASIIVPMVMANGEHYPSPFGHDDAASRYFIEFPGPIQLAAFLQLGAAIPLGIFVATATSRLRFLGARVAGVDIALFGGIAAAVFQTSSALVEWVLAQSGAVDSHAFHLLQFAVGGPAFVASFGIVIAGIAVTAGLQRLAPRWVMFGGLAIAAIAETSSLTLVVPAMAILLPIARFTGFAWLVCLAAVLPKHRRPDQARVPAVQTSGVVVG
jgi:hypothetical protein